MKVSATKCSLPTCSNILPPEMPGEKSYKKCPRCQERDKATAAKHRAEKKRKRADSGNDTPRQAPAPQVDRNNVPDAISDPCDPSGGQEEHQDQDNDNKSDSGTEVSMC